VGERERGRGQEEECEGISEQDSMHAAEGCACVIPLEIYRGNSGSQSHSSAAFARSTVNMSTTCLKLDEAVVALLVERDVSQNTPHHIRPDLSRRGGHLRRARVIPQLPSLPQIPS
jgi:hypothetical protein